MLCLHGRAALSLCPVKTKSGSRLPTRRIVLYCCCPVKTNRVALVRPVKTKTQLFGLFRSGSDAVRHGCLFGLDLVQVGLLLSEWDPVRFGRLDLNRLDLNRLDRSVRPAAMY